MNDGLLEISHYIIYIILWFKQLKYLQALSETLFLNIFVTPVFGKFVIRFFWFNCWNNGHTKLQ